ncbi:MAG: HypC/HybG/HupF family hydrogenase formation chaperone [Actinomycetota bacterium]|nr:HypC/HybG/HupF family hydrogenase formation chaperone [Actinomycetota bacterium]
MCLGIPGEIVELKVGHDHLARVNITGVSRMVNVGLLEDENLQVGDWVLIHVGFAMSKIDEAEAEMALEGLQLMGQAYAEEIDAMDTSTVTTDAMSAPEPAAAPGRLP